MKPCDRCGSQNVRPYDTKPPRKHPDGRIECDPDCTVTVRFCRACRSVSRETFEGDSHAQL